VNAVAQNAAGAAWVFFFLDKLGPAIGGLSEEQFLDETDMVSCFKGNYWKAEKLAR
jgi:hypothetical protein